MTGIVSPFLSLQYFVVVPAYTKIEWQNLMYGKTEGKKDYTKIIFKQNIKKYNNIFMLVVTNICINSEIL